jgi:hypothetical protein
MGTTYAYETNNIADFDGPKPSGDAEVVAWTTPGLHVTRLRLVTDEGCPFWDISYCWGTLNGRAVRVQLPFYQLSRSNWSGEIIEHAKRDGVNAKRMGVFDAISKPW